eukprot:TRINITY_DN33248_c0_g1_i1.p1 TRINITY_DN33248_c0_g1~~TRINITY_DN33248_c0_g1_i1.p1  ORF type:complete len:624 (-),score=118.92 TRINITY_DN33248_c0_g1_i1:1268-3139(-)
MSVVSDNINTFVDAAKDPVWGIFAACTLTLALTMTLVYVVRLARLKKKNPGYPEKGSLQNSIRDTYAKIKEPLLTEKEKPSPIDDEDLILMDPDNSLSVLFRIISDDRLRFHLDAYPWLGKENLLSNDEWGRIFEHLNTLCERHKIAKIIFVIIFLAGPTPFTVEKPTKILLLYILLWIPLLILSLLIIQRIHMYFMRRYILKYSMQLNGFQLYLRWQNDDSSSAVLLLEVIGNRVYLEKEFNFNFIPPRSIIRLPMREKDVFSLPFYAFRTRIPDHEWTSVASALNARFYFLWEKDDDRLRREISVLLEQINLRWKEKYGVLLVIGLKFEKDFNFFVRFLNRLAGRSNVAFSEVFMIFEDVSKKKSKDIEIMEIAQKLMQPPLWAAPTDDVSSEAKKKQKKRKVSKQEWKVFRDQMRQTLYNQMELDSFYLPFYHPAPLIVYILNFIGHNLTRFLTWLIGPKVPDICVDGMLAESFKKSAKQPVVYAIAAILWAPPMFLTGHYFFGFCIFAYMAFTIFASSSFLLRLRWKSAFLPGYVEVVSRSVVYCTYIAWLQGIAIGVDKTGFEKLMIAAALVTTLVLIVVTRSTAVQFHILAANTRYVPRHMSLTLDEIILSDEMEMQ